MVDPEVGRIRSLSRLGEPDRLERERGDFFDRTVAGYGELWAQDPERIRKIDGSQPPHEVLAAALEELGDLIPPPPTRSPT
jgi:dTMP kinase